MPHAVHLPCPPGACFPGEFEERLKGVLKELTSGAKQYILFIDDIHTMTGPNAQQGGGVMDASILLKPLLSRWAPGQGARHLLVSCRGPWC